MDYMQLYFQMKSLEYIIGYVILFIMLAIYGLYKYIEWRDNQKEGN